MPKGVHISQETRIFLHQLFIVENLDANEVFERRFRSDAREISLERLYKLGQMFRDPNRDVETACYLGANRKRGNQGIVDGNIEIDIFMERILKKFPQAALDFYRLKLAEMRGHDVAEYSDDRIRASLWRCKGNRKRVSFFSGLQDSARIEIHMNEMRTTHVDNIVSLDETAGSYEKRRPKYGRGPGLVVVHEWNIDSRYFSAMAAMTTRGFIRWVIKEGIFTHEDVEEFVEHLAQLITPNDCLLFDNASIHVVDSTLVVIDRVFNGNWKRNVEFCPQLNPIEKGFALIWSYVQRRWLDAQRNPLRVLEDAFQYYSVGGPGGNICKTLFNVYARNRGGA